MALRKYRMKTRHWGACSVFYAVPRAGDSVLNLISACQSACSGFFAVPRAGDSVLNLISACQSDDWECIFCCIRDIVKYLFAHNLPNHPHLQLVTPLWPPIPLQPHRLHNHPHPITILNHPHPSSHTPPKTTFIPQLHTLQNRPHPSNCPHPSTTHINHTYPPTIHTPYQPPTPDASPSCTNEYTGTRWPSYMKSINVNKLCCGQIKCSVNLPVHWLHSCAWCQDVEAAQLDGWSKDGAALITTTPHISCIHVVQQSPQHLPSSSVFWAMWILSAL